MSFLANGMPKKVFNIVFYETPSLSGVSISFQRFQHFHLFWLTAKPPQLVICPHYAQRAPSMQDSCTFYALILKKRR